eukprot:scaffold173037_cov30-Tisochrysis_lutea.AAC.2
MSKERCICRSTTASPSPTASGSHPRREARAKAETGGSQPLSAHLAHSPPQSAASRAPNG